MTREIYMNWLSPTHTHIPSKNLSNNTNRARAAGKDPKETTREKDLTMGVEVADTRKARFKTIGSSKRSKKRKEEVARDKMIGVMR